MGGVAPCLLSMQSDPLVVALPRTQLAPSHGWVTEGKTLAAAAGKSLPDCTSSSQSGKSWRGFSPPPVSNGLTTALCILSLSQTPGCYSLVNGVSMPGGGRRAGSTGDEAESRSSLHAPSGLWAFCQLWRVWLNPFSACCRNLEKFLIYMFSIFLAVLKSHWIT